MTKFIEKFETENPEANLTDKYEYPVSDVMYSVYEYDTHKLCEASDGSYHYAFNKQDCMFSRWGKTEEDDPTFCPAGPEILDLEIASGKCSGNCPFCLPEGVPVNTPDGTIDIEKLKIGDKVLGFDFEKNSIREELVKEVHSRDFDGLMVVVEMENGKIVELTEDHNVMLMNGKEVRAGDLTLEDDVVVLKMKIENIIKTPFKGKVYDIGCEPDHVFFTNGLLVHNCYKGNSANQEAVNMTFDTFKTIIDKMPKCLTQIAIGICDIDGNPDFLKMMEYSRSIGIIPNFTLSGIGLTDEMAEKVSKLSGALAVSAYETDKNICYDTIKKFTDLGMNQVNCHIMISEETFPFVAEVLNDRMHDPRLAEMNAIVFLGVKPKGRAKGAYHPLSSEKYASLVKLCLQLGIPFGFDSCSCFAFLKSIESLSLKEDFKKSLYEMSEPCESTLMSAYINTDGVFFPCSFTEGEQGWKEGVDVVGCKDFLKDVWHNRKVTEARRKIMNCRECRESCFNFKEINVKWE